MVRKKPNTSQGPFEEKSSTLGKQESSLITSLIEECEEYVRTEEFTKDLSSEILKLFMNERAQHIEQQHDDEDNKDYTRESFYDNDKSVIYDKNNDKKHEESPDSIDSAYDSDVIKKESYNNNNNLKNNNNNPFHHIQYQYAQMSTEQNYNYPQMSKSSSLSHFLEDGDNISNASTIKNATRQFRDESISYDTVLRQVLILLQII